MIAPGTTKKILLQDIRESPNIASLCYISDVETRQVYRMFEEISEEVEQSPLPQGLDPCLDEAGSVLRKVSAIFSDATLYSSSQQRRDLGNFISAIGAADPFYGDCLFDSDEDQQSDASENSNPLVDEITHSSAEEYPDLFEDVFH